MSNCMRRAAILCGIPFCLLLDVPQRGWSAGPEKELIISGKEIPQGSIQAGAGGWWSVNGALNESVASPQPSLFLVGDKDWNTYSASVGVQIPKPGSNSEAGLALQVRDSSNYVVFSLLNRSGGPFAVLRIVNKE